MSDHLVTYLVKWADKGCSAPDEKECRDAFPDVRDWCRACFATEILQWKEAEVEKFLRAAATAGASVPPPHTWQPIDTAPKRDGVLVLLSPSRCWAEDANADCEVGYWDDFAQGWISVGPTAIDYHGPTHWMPLPPTPLSGRSDEPTSRESLSRECNPRPEPFAKQRDVITVCLAHGWHPSEPLAGWLATRLGKEDR